MEVQISYFGLPFLVNRDIQAPTEGKSSNQNLREFTSNPYANNNVETSSSSKLFIPKKVGTEGTLGIPFTFLFGMGNSRHPVVSVLAYLRPENVSNLHCGPDI